MQTTNQFRFVKGEKVWEKTMGVFPSAKVVLRVKTHVETSSAEKYLNPFEIASTTNEN